MSLKKDLGANSVLEIAFCTDVGSGLKALVPAITSASKLRVGAAAAGVVPAASKPAPTVDAP